MSNESNRLAKLVTPAQYQTERDNIFPSASSLAWFMRQQRDELLSAGALLTPAGRTLIEPDAFDQVVLKVGAGRAAA